MPKVTCNYGVHFSELAGKLRETVELKGETLGDLIKLLDEKYEGFSLQIVNPKDGSLYTFNAILIERPGEATTGIFDLGAKLSEGDVLTFF